MPLDPDAAAVLSAMQAQGLPPMETLTPQEVRDRTAAAAALSAPTRYPCRLGGRAGPGGSALPGRHARGRGAIRCARLAPRRGLGHRQRAAVAAQRKGAWRAGAASLSSSPSTGWRPSTPSPAAFDDAVAVTRAVVAAGVRIGRPRGQGRCRWRFGGRQPGRRGRAFRPRLSFQVLAYPVIDATMRHAVLQERRDRLHPDGRGHAVVRRTLRPRW